MRCNFFSLIFKGFSFLIALFLLASCSEDDAEPLPEIPEVTLSAFLNTDSEEIQVDMVSGRNDPLVTSLSDEFGLQNLVFARRDIDENSVAFYSWQGQQSRAYYKNLDSGALFFAEDICGFSGENQPDRTVRRVSGNETYVVMPYAGFGEGPDPIFSLRILEKASGICRDLAVPEVNPSGIENYSIEGDLLAIYYLQDGTGNPLISIINLGTGILEDTLVLDAKFLAATFRDSELWIFNNDSSYLIYDTQSGNFIRTGAAPGIPTQGPGMFDSQFDGNSMLVRFIYQQPSLFFAQPAVYDFDQGVLTEGSAPFLPELQTRIERETGDRVLFGKYDTDLPSGIIAIIYVRGNGLPEGGVVLTNFRLDWVDILPLPYIPEHVEIRSIN